MTTTTNSKHFGYYLFGKDMASVDLPGLKKNGVTDIFLNYYAFETYGESKVLSWITKANQNNINVHVWMQCFYDGEWHNPKTTDLSGKLREAKRYASMKNVTGVHLDYLRYPGNAYKTSGGADAITSFVKKVRSQNPGTFLSCAIMPESQGKYYYGQDQEALGKIVDAILPMQYKGNYSAGTSWLTDTTKALVKKGTIWSALQSYKSDDNPTKLSSTELLKDAKTCLDNGAKGAIIFRYGLSVSLNFTSLIPNEGEKMTTTYTYKTILSKSKTIKKNLAEKQEIGLTNRWCYYICREIIKPKTDIKGISIKDASKPNGDHISRQIYKSSYMDMAERLVKYVEKNSKMPNHIAFTTQAGKKYQIDINLCTEMFARILIYYDTNKKYPKYANINAKALIKPTETTNSVFEYFVKKFGKITCIDDALEKIDGNGYGYYYDDGKSNRETIDAMANSSHSDDPNCTDSCQVFYNLGLEFVKKGKYKKVECLHVKCQGGDGHVRLRFTLPNGDQFYRDPAAVLDGNGVTGNWCLNGSLLAVDPSWFMQNVNR